ncbi:hypothetical protein D3C76_1524070 [compost metagenome]
MLWIELFDEIQVPVNRIRCASVPAAPVFTLMWWKDIYSAIFAVQIPIAADADIGV